MIPQLFMKEEVTRMVYQVGEYIVTDYISDEHGLLDTVITGPRLQPWTCREVVNNPETIKMIKAAFANFDQA